MIKYLALFGMIVIMLILAFISPNLVRVILAVIACIPLVVMLISTVGVIWMILSADSDEGRVI